jgi:hypothetical protein
MMPEVDLVKEKIEGKGSLSWLTLGRFIPVGTGHLLARLQLILIPY